MNLAATSRPREVSKKFASDVGDVLDRQATALALSARYQQDGPRRFYCSPLVVQEFYWACARALVWVYRTGVELGADGRHREMHTMEQLWNEIDRCLNSSEDARKAIMACDIGSPHRDAVKACLSAVTDIVGKRFRKLRVIIAREPWDEEDKWLDDYEDFLKLGCLNANDSLIALTARRLKVQEIYTDDYDFEKAREKVESHFPGLKVTLQDPIRKKIDR